MKTAYFDTSYLFRLYWKEPGWEAVRDIASGCDVIASAWHASAELESVLLRKRREGEIDHRIVEAIGKQLAEDQRMGGLRFLPLDERVMLRLRGVMREAPAQTFLRAADAMHLACAAVHGFQTVYSNDTHFLKAASLFGVNGLNVIRV